MPVILTYLKTPPNATSSPKIHAVGSLSIAISIALVMACNKVIFVVSPKIECSFYDKLFRAIIVYRGFNLVKICQY